MAKRKAATNRRRNRAPTIDFKSWFRHHKQCAIDSLLRLVKQPISSALTWLVIAIAIMLPTLFYVAFHAVNLSTQAWQAGGQITLYLIDDTTKAEGLKLSAELADRPEIELSQFISKDQAWSEFRNTLTLTNELVDFENPLPASIVLIPTLQDAVELEAMILTLQGLAHVDNIQIDLDWINRLNQLLSLAEKVVQLLGVILAVAVILIVGNTIRLNIESRKDEIIIIKLLGATDAYIKRPFVYLGFWYGFIGGIAAWLLITTISLSIHPALDSFLSSYGISAPAIWLEGSDIILLLLASILISLFGARIALWRHLRDIESAR
jgi:cell division transport system permease protein